eukprot:COSAG04_NODE_2539_length_3956_cov_4.847031_5_plen_154_part_00
MEAASGAPIYGTQWHPERNQFQFSLSAGEDNIEHSTHALVAMQTTANFFVAHEARRNAHAFASVRLPPAPARELGLRLGSSGSGSGSPCHSFSCSSSVLFLLIFLQSFGSNLRCVLSPQEAELAKALLYNDQPHGRQGDSYRAYMFKPWAAHD